MEELDLKELFDMFWTRKVQILLIVLIFMVVGGIYTFAFVSPVYMSYTTILLATSDSSASKTDTITTSDITINNNLVDTYSELIKSKKVLRQVIDNLDISKDENALKSAVSVSSVKNTQLIKVNVIDANPTQAKMIANEIGKVFSKEVAEYYKMNNVHTVDEAEVSEKPYNVNHVKDIGIFTFVGLVIAIGYVLVANMLDTTVKSKEDVEKKLGITVLTTIPLITNFDDTIKNGKKGGRR